MKDNDLAYGNINTFIEYNKKYDRGDFRGSEARKYDMSAITMWLCIRDRLAYVDEWSDEGEWRTLKIVTSCSKYGTNYIFIDIKNKLWRTKQTASEFYGSCPKSFDLEEFENGTF